MSVGWSALSKIVVEWSSGSSWLIECSSELFKCSEKDQDSAQHHQPGKGGWVCHDWGKETVEDKNRTGLMWDFTCPDTLTSRTEQWWDLDLWRTTRNHGSRPKTPPFTLLRLRHWVTLGVPGDAFFLDWLQKLKSSFQFLMQCLSFAKQRGSLHRQNCALSCCANWDEYFYIYFRYICFFLWIWLLTLLIINYDFKSTNYLLIPKLFLLT